MTQQESKTPICIAEYDITPPAGLLDAPLDVNSNGLKVLKQRYLLKDAHGSVVETVQEMFWRVASCVAAAAIKGPRIPTPAELTETAAMYYRMMSSFEFVPNSPTFSGAGTPLGQLAACFVLPVSDDMGRDLNSGIFSTLRNATLVQQTGGGVGFSFSSLRPSGDVVHSSGGRASGPLSFIKAYNEAFGAIAQGGCLEPNTLVHTTKGVLRLSEIVDGSKPGWQEHNIAVHTDYGVRISLHGFNNGVVPVKRVTVANGISITGTPNHRLKVEGVNGTEWRTLDQLKHGDRVQMQLGLHSGLVQDITLPPGADPVALPMVFRGATAYLFGYMSVTMISVQDDTAMFGISYISYNSPTAVADLARSVFPGAVVTLKNPEDAGAPAMLSQVCVIKSSHAVELMRVNGFGDPTELSCRVPKIARVSGAPELCEYLCGIASACGIPGGSDTSFAFETESLAIDIATLMAGLGTPLQVIGRVDGGAMEHYCEASLVSPECQAAWAGRSETTPPRLCLPLCKPPCIVLTAVTKVEDCPEHCLTLDLEVEDNHTYIANALVTHNTRRGANMGVLRVDHPDIEAFIKAKSVEGVLSNFNLSVGITNEFMEKVETYGDYSLVNPRTKEVAKTIPARDVFDQIVAAAHKNGEPGVLFLDTANAANPVPHLYNLEATNPCVTGDTMVSTDKGKVRVDSLIDKPFNAMVSGEVYRCNTGFFKTGTKPVFKLTTSDGHEVKLTADHQVLCARYGNLGFEFVPAIELHETDKVITDDGEPYYSDFKDLVPCGVEDVYDCTVDEGHAFSANGVVVHNCGEQWLGPYESCCLGSVNLSKFTATNSEDPTGPKVVNWEKLAQTVEKSVYFLDDVITVNKFVPSVPKLSEAAAKCRRIGLGVMGLADLCYAMQIRYGSDQMIDLSGQIMEFIRFHAMKASIKLAELLGPFPAISGSVFDPRDMKWRPPVPARPYIHTFRPSLEWSEIASGIVAHGIRNCAQTTIAPTGTIGTVSGCEGYGCEPVFALAYVRHVVNNDSAITSSSPLATKFDLTYVSPLFAAALDGLNFSSDKRAEILDRVIESGSCQDIRELPEHIRHTFVVSNDITAIEHITVQAALQRFVDNSISKTINFSSGASQQDISDAYRLAWRMGCKGLTVYVTGSRKEVVLETVKSTAKQITTEVIREPSVPATSPVPEIAVHHNLDMSSASVTPTPAPVEEAAPTVTKMDGWDLVNVKIKQPRPVTLHGTTVKAETPLGEAFVTINRTPDNQPFEVFMNVGKGGSDVASVSEAIGRLISFALRIPSPVPPLDRLYGIANQLDGIGGRKAKRIGSTRVTSLPDAVAKVLKSYADELSSMRDGEHDPDQVPSVICATNTAAAAVGIAIESVHVTGNAIGDICNECGNSTLLNIEGCRKCHVCGYSEC